MLKQIRFRSEDHSWWRWWRHLANKFTKYRCKVSHSESEILCTCIRVSHRLRHIVSAPLQAAQLNLFQHINYSIYQHTNKRKQSTSRFN